MKNQLKVIPLGGLGEIGKNMMILEYNNEAIRSPGYARLQKKLKKVK